MRPTTRTAAVMLGRDGISHGAALPDFDVAAILVLAALINWLIAVGEEFAVSAQPTAVAALHSLRKDTRWCVCRIFKQIHDPVLPPWYAEPKGIATQGAQLPDFERTTQVFDLDSVWHQLGADAYDPWGDNGFHSCSDLFRRTYSVITEEVLDGSGEICQESDGKSLGRLMSMQLVCSMDQLALKSGYELMTSTCTASSHAKEDKSLERFSERIPETSLMSAYTAARA